MQRLLGRAVEQYLDYANLLSRDDPEGPRRDAICEVACKGGGERVAPAALDPIGHAE